MAKLKLVANDYVKSPVTEAYRTLRTNLFFSGGEREPKTIMFTSTGRGEGKSITAANVAVVLAQCGQKVIVLDCDLRRPAQHKIFRKQCKGLTNVLIDNAPLQQMLVDTGIAGVQLLPSGQVPQNPAELLGTQKMQQVLGELSARADYVIIDTPPVLAVTDACVLASKVDGIGLVLGAGSVKPELAQRAKELLLRAKGQILGVILNRVEVDEEALYGYYYGNRTAAAR